MVTEQGRQPTEAAKELGICIDTLCSWLKRRLALSGNRKRPVYQEDCGVRILRACLRSLGGSARSWRLRPWKWHTAAASLQKAVSHQVCGAVRCVCLFGVFLQYPPPLLRSGLDSSLSFRGGTLPLRCLTTGIIYHANHSRFSPVFLSAFRGTAHVKRRA